MEYNKKGIRLVNQDCLKLLKTLDNDSIDLIATDPPYYKVKSAKWDRQWKTKSDFFAWLETVLREYQRVLKPTGSLYLFCGPYLADETAMLISKYFNVMNHIVWCKPSGNFRKCCKESLRKYFPQTERIIFAESKKPAPFPYESIRHHLASTTQKAGLSSKLIQSKTNTQMTGHWFGKSQFSLPSESHYQTMIRLGAKLKPYAKLRREYQKIRSGLTNHRRYFHVTKQVPFTDVWHFPVVEGYPGKHPCEKPLPLMEHIIESSSRPGGLVLDTFGGSGTTAIAAAKQSRRFIGCEKGKTEFRQCIARLREARIKELKPSSRAVQK